MPRLRPKAVLPSTLALIGWRERVGLPSLGIKSITAKIDTGARTAALHAEEIEVLGRIVRFRVPLNGRSYQCEAPLAGHRRVKNTSGQAQVRAVIETVVLIGTERVTAEVTLTGRADMGVPMLLGRTTVRGKFIVHPGRSFLISRPKAVKAKLP